MEIPINFAKAITPDLSIHNISQLLAKALDCNDKRNFQIVAKEVGVWIDKQLELPKNERITADLIINEVLLPCRTKTVSYVFVLDTMELILKNANLEVDWSQIVIPMVFEMMRLISRHMNVRKSRNCQKVLIERLLKDKVYKSSTEALELFAQYKPEEALQSNPFAYYQLNPVEDPEMYIVPRFERDINFIFERVGWNQQAVQMIKCVALKFPYVPRRVIRSILYDFFEQRFHAVELETCKKAVVLLTHLHQAYFWTPNELTKRFDERLSWLHFLNRLVRQIVDSPQLSKCPLRSDGETVIYMNKTTTNLLFCLLYEAQKFAKKQFNGDVKNYWQKAQDAYAEWEQTKETDGVKAIYTKANAFCVFLRRLFATVAAYGYSEGRWGIDAEHYQQFVDDGKLIDYIYTHIDNSCARCDELMLSIPNEPLLQIAESRRADIQFPISLIRNRDVTIISNGPSTVVYPPSCDKDGLRKLIPNDIEAQRSGAYNPNKGDLNRFAELDELLGLEKDDRMRPHYD
ncbi:hypothetical protein M3Y94_00620200 [Aphelenchoides besseyi]|nr:hypothetical protein M3Y94_00620200 [Aphelenchoides besseyi]